MTKGHYLERGENLNLYGSKGRTFNTIKDQPDRNNKAKKFNTMEAKSFSPATGDIWSISQCLQDTSILNHAFVSLSPSLLVANISKKSFKS